MPLSNFKKILFAGTALVAVSAFSTQALALPRVLTAAGTWASSGVPAAGTALIADAVTADAVSGNFILTVTNDATANDGLGLNTFSVGAVTGAAAGLTTVNGSANDLTVTIASAVYTGLSPISISNTGFVANGNATTITGNLSNVGGGNLTITNASTAAAKAVSLTVGGTVSLTGTTAITAGAVAGADATLTLGGATNAFTGAVTLTDGAAGLAKVVVTGAAATFTGGIDGSAAGKGTLTLGNTGVTGVIGGTNKLLAVNFTGAGASSVSGATSATTVTVSGAGTVTQTGALTATTLKFTADGTVLMGAANLTAAVTTATTNKGTLSLGGAGTVTGQVGATGKWLKAVNAGTGANIFTAAVYATDVKIAGGTGTFNGAVTANLGFTGTGTANIKAGLTGNVDFVNNAATVSVTDGKTISGTIKSTGGANGTLNVLGTSTFLGAIGGGASGTGLAEIKAGITGKTAIFNSTVNATKVTVTGAGNLNFNDTVALTGALAYGATTGTVTVASGKNLSTGSITGAGAGTLTLAGGTQAVTGTISNNSLIVNAGQATGATTTFAGQIGAATINLGAGTGAFNGQISVTTVNVGAGTATFGGAANVLATTVNVGSGTATFGGTAGITNFNLGTGSATFTGVGTGALNFTGDGSATATAAWVGAVTTAANNTGSMTFNGVAAGVTTIGSSTKALKNLTLGANVTASGIVNAQNIHLGANKVLTTGAAFTLASGQTLSVTPAGAGSVIHHITTTGAAAVGNVTFASGSNILITPTGTIAAANTYEIAIANGTALTSLATIQSGVPGWSFAGSIAAKTLTITPTAVAITSNTDMAQVQISKGTGTVLALANAITAATTLTAKNNLREAALPTVDGSAVFSLLDAGEHVTSVIETRMASIRGGNASGMAAGYGAKGDNAWIQGYANSSNQNKRKGIAGYNSNLGGIALGYDSATVIDGGVFGVAFNYGRTSADSDNANTTSTDINSYGFTAYANIPLQNKMFLDAQVGYTFDDLQIDRHNAGGAGLTANGDTTANQYAAKLSLGRDYATTSGMTITPDVSASWLALDTASYTEKGTGTLLSVGNQRFNALDLGVGAKATWETKNHDGSTLRPEIKIGYAYDVIGDAVDVSSSFVAVGTGAAFKTNGLDPSRSKFDAGLGFTYASPENWDLSAKYDYVYKADYESHNGTIRLTSHF